MSRNTKKFKRTSTKTNEKISSTQKKLRNENEKRRRDLFSQLITNIGEIIFNNNQPIKLSKNAILRQTVTFLQEQRNYLQNENNCRQNEISSKILNFVDFSWKPSSDILSIEEWFQIVIESMNSFFLIFKVDSIDKQIVYVSKNIVNYLAYDQQQLVHRSIYEFIHPICRSTFDSYLQMENETLTCCQLLWKQSFNDDYEQCSIIGAKRTFNDNQIHFVCLVQIESVDRTSRFDLNDNEEEFSTHLNNQGKFIYLNRQGEFFLGYQSIELIGRTYFDFVHPDDLPIVKRAHQLWIQNGSGQSQPHRFLTKGQQWIFIQTNSQVQINSWNKKPLFYICQHQIIQCSTNLLKQQLTKTSNDSLTIIQQQQQQQQQISSPSSTSEISSFLNEITDEISRKRIIDKFVKLRQTKEEEIHNRQDEIEVINDILHYVQQYEIKQTPTNLLDSSMLNSPVTNSSQFQFDSLSSLFSPLIASTLALPSPITPTSNPNPN